MPKPSLKVITSARKRVQPAAKPARAPRKTAAKTTRAAKAPPQKTSGFAVGVSPLNYAWVTATAEAIGKSRQAVMDSIINKLLSRATLGTTSRRRR